MNKSTGYYEVYRKTNTLHSKACLKKIRFSTKMVFKYLKLCGIK